MTPFRIRGVAPDLRPIHGDDWNTIGFPHAISEGVSGWNLCLQLPKKTQRNTPI